MNGYEDGDERFETSRWAVRWLATLSFCLGAAIGSMLTVAILLTTGAIR